MRVRNIISWGWISLLAVLLAACGGGGGGGSSNPLELLGLGSGSAQPLTSLLIKIKGGSSDPITVTYASGGFSVTGAVLAQTASSVTAAVPIYMNPGTHVPSAGQVSVTLNQDGTTTSAATLDITALPTAVDYGMSRGQITHAFLIYQQMLLAHQLNDMQSVQQAIPTSTVNPARAVATLYYNLIPAANGMRNDVDQATNLGNTFGWYVSTSGKTLQMDGSQVDVMDSILGAMLLQEFGNSTAVRRYFTGRTERAVGGGAPDPRDSNTLAQITQFISLNNSINDLTDEIRQAPNSFYHAAQAGMTGLKMYFDAGGEEDSSNFVGAVSSASAFGTAVSTQLELLLPTATCLASTTCDSSYAADLANQEQNAGLDAAKADASLMSSVTALGGFSNEISSLTSESFQAAVTAYQQATNGDTADLSSTSTTAAENLGPVIPDLGVVTGNMSVSNSIGSAASLTAVQIQNCAGGCGSYNITTMADQGGSYDLVIPFDTGGVNFSSMTIVGYDFATNTGLTSETVNLSGLNTGAPVQVPAMSATCNDTDYGTPDSDDPDCD